MRSQQRIKINPAKVYLTRKMDLFSQNDGYLVFKLGEQAAQTKVRNDMRSFQSDEEFVFKPEGKNVLKVTAYDMDEFTSDQIGQGEIDLTPYFNKQQPDQAFVRLTSKVGTPGGKVLFKIYPEEVPLHSLRLPVARSNKQIKFYQSRSPGSDIPKQPATSQVSRVPPVSPPLPTRAPLQSAHRQVYFHYRSSDSSLLVRPNSRRGIVPVSAMTHSYAAKQPQQVHHIGGYGARQEYYARGYDPSDHRLHQR